MMKALHERPSSNQIHRITGVTGTHMVLYNPLINEYKIESTNGRSSSGRDSKWHRMFIGSEVECQNYINRKCYW